MRIARVVGLFHSLAVVMASPAGQTVLSGNIDNFIRPEGNPPTLADLLTLEGRASIFYSYARETDMSAWFTKEGQGVTVFVPTDKAVQALARKPHEGPELDTVGITDAEHDAISRSNVQRWVGGHIIPSPNVDFKSLEPYNTLTTGVTIAFHAVSSEHHPAHEPVLDRDDAHFASVKGGGSHLDTDPAHMAAVKGCHASGGKRNCGHSRPLNTDSAHLASIKAPASSVDSSRADTDATHLTNVKHSRVSNGGSEWKQYELSGGVHIIAAKKASNGVMYLIDGTITV